VACHEVFDFVMNNTLYSIIDERGFLKLKGLYYKRRFNFIIVTVFFHCCPENIFVRAETAYSLGISMGFLIKQTLLF